MSFLWKMNKKGKLWEFSMNERNQNICDNIPILFESLKL